MFAPSTPCRRISGHIDPVCTLRKICVDLNLDKYAVILSPLKKVHHVRNVRGIQGCLAVSVDAGRARWRTFIDEHPHLVVAELTRTHLCQGCLCFRGIVLSNGERAVARAGEVQVGCSCGPAQSRACR